MKELTERQKGVLSFMRRFFVQEDRLPSTREIQEHFGFRSQTAARSHLLALEKKGYIEHRTRSVRGGENKGYFRFAR